MNGWRMAEPSDQWIGKSDGEICSHVKDIMNIGRNVVEHFRRDGGGVPFIEAAFRGDRSLDAGARAIYEAETGKTFRAEPPPGTHLKLIQQAQNWVTAASQGGELVGDDDCGCVADKVEILFHSAMTIVTPRVTSTITGEGSLVVKFGPTSPAPGWDVAMGAHGDSLKVVWSGISISQPAGCDGKVVIKASPATQFKIWFGMSYLPNLKLSLQVIPGADIHQIENRCLLPNGTWLAIHLNDPISLFAGAWNELHGKSAEAVVLKANAAMDFTKMDPKAIMAMANAMKNNPDPAAAAAQMTALINKMMPGASQLAAEARNNYTFAIPDNSGCSLGTGTAFLAQCDFNRTITVPAGAGPPQTITESTTITIGRPSPARP
jgi:hypothetical protein